MPTISAVDRLTGDANDDKRLSSKEREDNGTEDGREEDLVDPVALPGLLEHVQGERKCWEDANGAISSLPPLAILVVPLR